LNQLLVYADDVNLLVKKNINISKKSTEAVLDTDKEIGLKVNAEKSMYILMSHHQTTGHAVHNPLSSHLLSKIVKIK
jgi:hypothetical protein